MDFKELLKKYMVHVAAVNGDSLNYNHRTTAEDSRRNLPIFTASEVHELLVVEQEAKDQYPDANL